MSRPGMRLAGANEGSTSTDDAGPTGAPTSFDDAYKGAGQKAGVEIWRVEKFKVVKKPPADPSYKGTFFSGDSYIVLETKQKASALERHIFFWLGAESSQDERGVAAYKTVELDESLGGEPTQHREVQAHETGDFKRLFNTLSYASGGVSSGFRKVDREAFTTRLLHVKGRRNISVSPVELSVKSMNVGDVFILDAGRDIYQWNGPEASRMEKQKAMEATRKLRDEERGGKARVHIVDPDDDDAAFWKAFGCSKPSSIAAATDDAAHEAAAKAAIELYHLSDDSGKLVVCKITDRPLKKDFLLTSDAYVLDTGAAGLWAWVGKKASPSEKKNAMHYATEFMKKKGYPDYTPITRIIQGGETPLFKQYFGAWPDKHSTGMGGLAAGNRRAAAPKKTFDTKAMLQSNRQVEEVVMPDDGTGKVTIWRIEDFDKVPLPEDQYGEFFGGDSYIILYEYADGNGRPAAFIYFWQGLKSTQDEVGTSALKATELDDEMGGYPVQVRVVQNKEPPHFCKIFKNKMVVHMGGKGSGFKNSDQQDEQDDDGTRLFHIRGTNEDNVRAVQVEEVATSLNSGDCFVLETPQKNFLWFGSGCSKEERAFTLQIYPTIDRMQHLDKDPDVIMEGREKPDFWAALGGQKTYGGGGDTSGGAPHSEPRLFQCSNNKGYFYAEEVFDFHQSDLIEEDVMLLDTGNEVFVWIGDKANKEERKEAMTLSLQYVDQDPSPRTSKDTVISVVKSGKEPLPFTCNFHGWDNAKRGGLSYEEQKAAMEEANPNGQLEELTNGSIADELAKLAPGGTIVPYAVLSGPTDKIPKDVDLACKENYLSNEEFEKYMKKTRAEYDAMPAWKKGGIKKSAKLY